MQLPPEIQSAQILDWWEDAHEHIVDALTDRLPALYYHVDQKLENMPITALIKKGKFRTDVIDPLVAEWIAKLYRELTHEMDESLRASFEKLEGAEVGDRWSYSDMAVAGAALAATAVPVAGVPFFAGGLTAGGLAIAGFTIVGGSVAILPVAALVGSVAALALGPAARASAVAKLKSGFRENIHRGIEARVMGDPKQPEIPSLKGVLIGELNSVAVKRMDMNE